MSEATADNPNKMYDSVRELFEAQRQRRGSQKGPAEPVDLEFDPESAADWSEKEKRIYLEAERREVEEMLKRAGINPDDIHCNGKVGLEAMMEITRSLFYPKEDIATGVPPLDVKSKTRGKR